VLVQSRRGFPCRASLAKGYELRASGCPVFQQSRSFPTEERFGLTAHLRRSATSIPSNIAEGCGREGERELARFLSIAAGSLVTLATSSETRRPSERGNTHAQQLHQDARLTAYG